MDAGTDKAYDATAAAMDKKLDEMKNLLDEYEIIQCKDAEDQDVKVLATALDEKVKEMRNILGQYEIVQSEDAEDRNVKEIAAAFDEKLEEMKKILGQYEIFQSEDAEDQKAKVTATALEKLEEIKKILEQHETFQGRRSPEDQSVKMIAASLGEKLEEMKDILRQYEIFQIGDTENHSIEVIEKQFTDGELFSCGPTTMENDGSTSEPQNESELRRVQKEAEQKVKDATSKSETPNIESKDTRNTELTGIGNGTIPNTVIEDGSAEFRNVVKYENVEVRDSINDEGNQTSKPKEITHESEGSENVHLIGKRKSPNADGEDDKTSTKRSIADNSKALDDESTLEIPKSQNHTLEWKGTEVVMFTAPQTDQNTFSEVDQRITTSPNSEDGAEGTIPSRKTEREFQDRTVEVKTNSVGNETSTSLTVESKSTQTEVTLQNTAVGDDGQEPRPQFQGEEFSNCSEREKIENYHEMKKPIDQAREPSMDKTQTTQTETLTQSASNMHPIPTAEGDNNEPCTSAQYSVSPQEDAAKKSTFESKKERGFQAFISNLGIEIAEEVHEGFSSSYAGTAKEGTTFIKLTPKEVDEALRKIGLRNPGKQPITLEDIKAINTEGRVNTTETSNSIQYGGLVARQVGETANTSGNLVKHQSAYRYAFQQGPKSTTGRNLRTLEDSLIAFDLYPRLFQLEDSLEEVRRHKRTPEEHEADCRSFDKELQTLSRQHHPDSVMRRGGTEEEVARAKDLQTALNATRTVLNTLNKMFMEDIDIEHSYQFFTKLDIGMLGNEDEVENHAYQVLFKISLVSEIKQESVVGEIRRFLEVGQRCIDSYLQNETDDFMKYRGSAFFYLKRCVTGYRKLHAELKEVETECMEEKLQNISPVIRRMKHDCWKQLRYLERLLELSKRPFGERYLIYGRTQPMDEYFLLPLDCYVHVIMACSMMLNDEGEGKGGVKKLINFLQDCFLNPPPPYERNQFPASQENLPDPQHPWNRSLSGKTQSSNVHANGGAGGDDAIFLLHKLASYYAGDKQYKTFVRGLLHTDHITKEVVKGQFRIRLKEVRDDLKGRFNTSDYVEKGTKKYIVKELQLCREMQAEFEEGKREVLSCIKEINKDKQSMKERLDKLLQNNAELKGELNQNLSEVKMMREEIEKISRKKLAN